MRKKILAFARGFFSILLLFLLFWFLRDELSEIPGLIIQTPWIIVFAASIFGLISVFLLSFRFKIILSGEDLQIPLFRAVQLTFVGYFFNNFIPTAIGGDIIKAYYVAKSNKQKIKSYTSVMMDRLLGLYTFLLIGVFAVMAGGGESGGISVRPILAVVGSFGIVFLIVICNSRMIEPLQQFLVRVRLVNLSKAIKKSYLIVHDYRNRKLIVAGSILISLVAQFFYFMVVYVLFLSFGVQLDLVSVFLIMPIVTLVSMMPSVGGLGFREGAMVLFFTPMAGAKTALAVSILFLACYHILVSLLGGATYLYWNLRRSSVLKAAENDQIKNMDV